MKAYIKGAAVVSPQKTFYAEGFPVEFIEYKETGQLKCEEPVYRDFIDPMVSRRMSRIIKMGVCAALKCLKDTNTQMPDAIIAGTGLGCLEDTEKFLASIYANEEKLLNPTPFIQSTHNTVAGAIALAIKCHHYNATYTHRGFSFESALTDALSQIEENPALQILTGAFDELTPNSYAITRRLGFWKNHPVDSFKLFEYKNRGSMAGEGVAFFMLSGIKSKQDMARISAVSTFYNPQNPVEANKQIVSFLERESCSINDIDLVIFGRNGDIRTDSYYDYAGSAVFNSIPQIAFKHLCGEYDTAASFALWLGSAIIHHGTLPSDFPCYNNKQVKINRILIYNQLRGKNHALYLLENVEL